MKKTFEINYKLRYAETEDWGQGYINATDQKQALKRFAKKMKIPAERFKRFEDWHWEEGVWWASFRNIREIKEKPCPHCCGTGTIQM